MLKPGEKMEGGSCPSFALLLLACWFWNFADGEALGDGEGKCILYLIIFSPSRLTELFSYFLCRGLDRLCC